MTKVKIVPSLDACLWGAPLRAWNSWLPTLSIKPQRGTHFSKIIKNKQEKCVKLTADVTRRPKPVLAALDGSSFLHTSNAFSMILLCQAAKMTIHNHTIVDISKENKWKLNAWQFKIFIPRERLKWYLERVWCQQSTFIFKTAAGIRIRLSWTVSKHQNQSKTTANVTKTRHLKIIKIKRSDDPPKAWYSLFTKRYGNNENVKKINISSPLRCQNH